MAASGYRALADFSEVAHRIYHLPEAVRCPTISYHPTLNSFCAHKDFPSILLEHYVYNWHCLKNLPYVEFLSSIGQKFYAELLN